MALVGVELETLVSKPDALTTRPAPRVCVKNFMCKKMTCVHLFICVCLVKKKNFSLRFLSNLKINSRQSDFLVSFVFISLAVSKIDVL